MKTINKNENKKKAKNKQNEIEKINENEKYEISKWVMLYWP